MSDSQRMERETEMRESELVSEFAAWIERVTVPTTPTDYQPRHRADGDAS